MEAAFLAGCEAGRARSGPGSFFQDQLQLFLGINLGTSCFSDPLVHKSDWATHRMKSLDPMLSQLAPWVQSLLAGATDSQNSKVVFCFSVFVFFFFCLFRVFVSLLFCLFVFNLCAKPML